MAEFVMLEKQQYEHIINLLTETHNLVKGLNLQQKDDFISNDDLCKKLGKSKKTLQTWRKDGLKFSARGRSIFYHMKDVTEYLELKKNK